MYTRVIVGYESSFVLFFHAAAEESISLSQKAAGVSNNLCGGARGANWTPPESVNKIRPVLFYVKRPTQTLISVAVYFH